MFTKKSVISLAASALLCSSVYAGSTTQYVPLTSKAKNNGWVLFGVNGLSDGVAASSSGTGFTESWIQLEDTTVADAIATSGLDKSGHMGALQALNLDNDTHELSYVKIAVDLSDVTFSATEPVRTMYIDANGVASDGVSGVDLKFEYKASLEGKKVQVQLEANATKTYEFTISYQNTYSNPASVTEIAAPEQAAVLTKMNDMIDYDIANNPLTQSLYTKTTDLNDVSSADVRLYSYDSGTSSWKLWDRDNSAAANDFTDFEIGKAYWGKIDLDGDNNATNTAAKIAGVITGSSGNTEPDHTVYADQLNNGWNLMAFDDVKPSIITASTGLILTLDGDNDLTIVDSTGLHSIDVAVTDDNIAATTAAAKSINAAIATAVGLGKMPKDTNIKAFVSAANKLVILSDKKFSVKDAAGCVAAVTTVAGQKPWDIGEGEIVAVTDLDSDGASSVYGEYMMMIEPLVGADTASDLDKLAKAGAVDDEVGAAVDTASSSAAAVTINGGDKRYFTPIATEASATLTTVQDALKLDPLLDATAAEGVGAVTQIDSDYADDDNELLLLASTELFYIKDNTFTRVHTYDNTDRDGTKAFKINSTDAADAAVTDDIAPVANGGGTNGDHAADVGALINAKAATLQVYAAAPDSTTLVTVTSSGLNFGLEDISGETNGFIADAALGSADIYKGAVKNVYAIDNMVASDIVRNKFVVTGLAFTDGGLPQVTGDDEIGVTLNGNNTAAIDETGLTAIDSDLAAQSANKLAWCDAIVAEINALARTNDIYAVASHDYTEAENDALADIEFTIEGYGITGANITVTDDATDDSNDGADSNSATASTLSSFGTALTSNLKYNSIYTPNYVKDGPLYTIKEAGLEAKAILSASTKIEDDNSIAWDSIDLTRDQAEWFRNNEYNLFKVSDDAGYWVYLDAINAPTISFTNTSYTPAFTHSFDPDGNTVNNIVSGTLTTQVEGIIAAEAKVYANIGGDDVELSGDGTNYTAFVSKYEVELVADKGSPIDISLTTSNGLGDMYSQASVATIDYSKPAVPTAEFTENEVNFSSTSDDVTSYYLYKDNIPETNTNTSSNKIARIASGDAATYNICANSDYDNAAAANISYKVFAMDGEDGELTKGNVSNVLSFTYHNFLKGASVLSHTYGDASAMLADVRGTDCASTGTATENTGVEIDTLTEDKSMKLSYVPDTTVGFNNNTPLTTYVTAGTVTFQLKSLPIYASDVYFVSDGLKVYEGTFPANEDANQNSGDALSLSAVDSTNETF